MNVTAMKKDLDTKRTEIGALLKSQVTLAESEKRERTAEEVAALQAKIDDANALKARIETAERSETQRAEIERFAGDLVPPARRDEQAPAPPQERRSLGAQLVEHPDYRRFIADGGHRRSGSWTTPTWELRATTLSEDAGSGGPLVIPQYLPGILPLPQRRVMVADLLAPGTADSNSIVYLREKTFTNAAAAVAEGAAKPESTLVFEQANTPVQKIAHWLPATEEMLEDVAAMRSYIDARLRLGLDLTEEDEILNGTGVAPHLLGLLPVTGKTADLARGADTNMDAMLKQITAIATGALVQPDGIVMHPTNWQAVQLLKNANGNYLGSGPWAPAQSAVLWGLPVAVTPAIAANTGLVGAFRMCAQLFKKGGVRVEVSNSHSDFFVKNLIAIRAEMREALAIYRPAGFGKVTGLN